MPIERGEAACPDLVQLRFRTVEPLINGGVGEATMEPLQLVPIIRPNGADTDAARTGAARHDHSVLPLPVEAFPCGSHLQYVGATAGQGVRCWVSHIETTGRCGTDHRGSRCPEHSRRRPAATRLCSGAAACRRGTRDLNRPNRLEHPLWTRSPQARAVHRRLGHDRRGRGSRSWVTDLYVAGVVSETAWFPYEPAARSTSDELVLGAR